MSVTHSLGLLGETVSPREGENFAQLKSFLDGHHGVAVLTGSDGATAELPREVYEVITQAVSVLAEGSAVTVAPISTKLTTTQAAHVLGVSRPTLIKMLDDGKIPFEQLNVHRTVLLADVLKFKQHRQAEQRAALTDLISQAQEYGLYDDSFDDYAEALEDARHHAA